MKMRKESLEKLERLLNLPAGGYEQDWDVELADGTRIAEFLLAYEHPSMTDDDKFALMALIVASVEQRMHAGVAVEQWREVESLLVRDFSLHRPTIDYWSRVEAEDPEEWFAVTPYARAVSAIIASGEKL
jgi:hypothetical protein